MEIEFIKYTKQYVVRETLIDVFGHMNNASYVQLFEEARWDLISDRGFGLDRIQKDGVGPIVLSLKTQFLKELKAREVIQITTEMISFKGKIGIIEQKMIKSNNQVACIGEFTIAMFDLKERKIIAPTTQWLSAFGEVKNK